MVRDNSDIFDLKRKKERGRGIETFCRRSWKISGRRGFVKLIIVI